MPSLQNANVLQIMNGRVTWRSWLSLQFISIIII